MEAVLHRCGQERTLRVADHDLAVRALLGMVNHSAQWYVPRARLSARAIADGYVDLLLRPPQRVE